MTWAATTGRSRQKTGAWTRKKLRRQRHALQTEQAVRADARRQPAERTTGRLPHEMR